MRRRKRIPWQHDASVIIVEGVVPNPEMDHDPLPDQILGIALDQRAFGPRRFMVVFADHDGRFLALLHARRTEPFEAALNACLDHFDVLGRGGVEHAAAVVLCDQPVQDGPPPPEFWSTFELAREIARKHSVHLVDWIACDDDLFRCARLRTFAPGSEAGWWDVPDVDELDRCRRHAG